MSNAPMPSRSSLVLECVRVMQVRIESGEWLQVLPGERRLAETLQVGRDTIRLALQLLEREGVLSPADAGSRRRIVGRGVEARDNFKVAENRASRAPQAGTTATADVAGNRPHP